MPIYKSNFKKVTSIIALLFLLTSMTSVSHAALGDKTLSPGMNDGDVRELQVHLKDLGHFKHNTNTSYYGRLTMEAVMDFQSKNKLQVDGYFGPNSFRILQTLIKSNNSSSSDKTTIESEDRPPTSNTSQLVYKRPLSIGSKGEDVKEFQDALKKLGYLNIDTTTTYFGTITETALIEFQQSLNITADGIAGPATYKSINNALNKNPNIYPPNRGDDNKNLTIDIINISKSYLNPKVPYVFGGNSINGMDCSAFTMTVYSRVGINIPRTSNLQAQVGKEIDRKNLKAGDLLIFSDTYRKGPSHTGIYLGQDEFIHASTSNNGITVTKLTDRYFENHFTFGRRLY